MRGTTRPIHEVATRVKRQPPKVKTFLCVVAGMAALVFLGCIIDDDDNNLFVAAEAVHALGISVLIYKLTKERTCAGLSLKSQNLTALFLAARLYCSLVMEYNIHTVLDTALATTLWVIYMIRLRLKTSYMEDKDNFAISYVIVPCALLALAVHPSTSHNIFNRICWAFCVYLEAVSVLPQLRLMQNTKIAEPFTAHYVFALGIAKFLNCAFWVLQVRRLVCPCSAKDDVSVGQIFTGTYIFNKVFDTCGRLLTALGYGLWPSMVLLAEMVQTSILAEFCFYYVKSLVGGQLVLRLPSG